MNERRERAIRWTGEVADGDGMNFNAQQSLLREKQLKQLEDNKNEEPGIVFTGTQAIDRLTGLPIGQEE